MPKRTEQHGCPFVPTVFTTSLSNGLASAAGSGWPPRSGNQPIHLSKQTSLSKRETSHVPRFDPSACLGRHEGGRFAFSQLTERKERCFDKLSTNGLADMSQDPRISA
jgi:hypothetical protein